MKNFDTLIVDLPLELRSLWWKYLPVEITTIEGCTLKMLPGMEEEEERQEDLTLGLLLDSYPQVGKSLHFVKSFSVYKR